MCFDVVGTVFISTASSPARFATPVASCVKTCCREDDRPSVFNVRPTLYNCTLSTTRLWSSKCAAAATVVRHYTAFVRAPNPYACFVHTQNTPRGLALKVAHCDPTLLAVFTASASRFLRSYWALPHAFILFRSQWERRLV